MKTEETITIKEVYEKAVQLETKIDGEIAKGDSVTRRFRQLVVLVIAIEVVNFLLNVGMIYVHYAQ